MKTETAVVYDLLQPYIEGNVYWLKMVSTLVRCKDAEDVIALQNVHNLMGSRF